MTGVSDWAGKLPRPTTPIIRPPTQMDKPVAPKVKEPKEKITSNTAILQDAASDDWSIDYSDGSLATTTATIRSRVSKGMTPLRIRINDNLEKKGKLASIQIPKPISAPIMSQTSVTSPEELEELPEDSIYPMDEGMMEDLDETLEQIQLGNRKRPKGLLLGEFKDELKRLN